MSRRRQSEIERRFNFIVGQAIARERRKLDISGADLARRLGMTKDGLYGLEAGRRCSLFMAVQIMEILKIELADLAPDFAHFSELVAFNAKKDFHIARPR